MTNKKLKDSVGLVDSVEIVHTDRYGNVISRHSPDLDCLTNVGFAIVAGLLLLDIGGTAFDYVAIGTGTVAADPLNTALGTEVSRLAGVGTRVTTLITNDTAQLVAVFSKALDAGLTGIMDITEVGVFNASSGVTMLMRQVWSPADRMNWDSLDVLTITVKIQCKQGA